MSAAADQLSLEIPEPPPREVSYVFGGKPDRGVGGVSDYRDQVAKRATSTRLRRAERGDRNAFDGALAAVRAAAAEYGSFSADDVEWPARGSEVGAAFNRLAKLGEIERCGYAVSRRPKAHGRLVRGLASDMNIDHSVRDMSWAVKLANRGYRAGQIARELSRTPSRKRPAGSKKYQRILETRGPDEAAKYAARTAENAVTFVRENPKVMDRSAAAVHLVAIETAAESLPWLTYCGPQARRALEAAFGVGWRVGSLSFGLSLREWAELAGLEFESIRTARDVLTREGWLRRNPNDRNGRTSRFTIATPSHIHSHGGDMNVGLHADRSWLTHDAFREPALGSEGWAVLRAVSVVPTPRDLIQSKLALDPEDLWEHLLGLERAHVLVVGDNSIRRASEDLIPLLDEIARDAGTMGELLRLRQKHLGDRTAWHERGDVNVGVVNAS